MIKYNGDFSFKRQVGATGPKPDPTYHLSRRNETWQGKEADLSAFLATRELGSSHPLYGADLKLAEYEPRYLEAGMVDVSLVYVGSAVSPGPVTTDRKNLLKTGTLTGKMVRRFERVVATSTLGGVTNQTWGMVEQEIDAEASYTYYTPSITYRYCASEDYKEAQLSAAADMAGATPSPGKQTLRITGQEWVTRAGFETGSDISGITIRNLTQTFEAANGETTGTPTLRSTDFSCKQVGLSGWYEVEETHEYELV